MFADSIARILDAIVAWLLTYAVHSTVLIAAAWIAAVCLARAACSSARLRDALPSIRERLWKLALVGGLVTAGAQAMFGFDPWGLQLALRTNIETEVASTAIEHVPAPTLSAVDLPAATAARPATPAITTTTVQRSTASETTSRPASLPAALVHTTELAPPVAPTVVMSVADPLPAPAADAQMPGWIQVAVLLWIAGVLFGLARWACQWNGLLRNLDDREPIVSGHVYEIFQHLRVRSKGKTNVALFAAPGLHAPITLGMRRFAICLPPRVATELQHDEIGALLAHELAHAERKDPVWVVACRAIEIVFFFQPLNKLCAGWLADEAEYLCDDRAVVQIGERVPLASCLTEIAGWIVHSAPTRLAPGMAAPGTRLSLRVGRLLDEDHDPNAPETSRWFTAAVVPAALCVAVFVPGVAAQAPLVEEEFAADCDDDAECDDGVECPEEELCDRTTELELVLQGGPEDQVDPEDGPLAADDSPPADPVVEPPAEKQTLVWVTTTNQFLLQPSVSASAPPVPDSADAIDSLDALADEIERMRAELETRIADESFTRRLEELTVRLDLMRERAEFLECWLDALEQPAPLADESADSVESDRPTPSPAPSTSVPSFPLPSKE